MGALLEPHPAVLHYTSVTPSSDVIRPFSPIRESTCRSLKHDTASRRPKNPFPKFRVSKKETAPLLMERRRPTRNAIDYFALISNGDWTTDPSFRCAVSI